MKTTPTLASTALALLVAVTLAAGCDSGQKTPAEKPAADGHDDHAHNEKAPHGGHLIELGRDHKYHAELVEDDATESITVYILDHDMKSTPADDDELTLVLTVDGKATSHKLTTSAAGEAGHKSQYSATGSDLFHALEDHKEATGKLRVTIGGTPYVGEVEHAHHHEDGEHAAHDDDHK